MIDIDRLKASLNIVDVIDGYLPLKKAGKNYTACCPFHGEKTPSFSVDENKQFYHCFGCGASGDVIGFVQDYCNVEFLEAVKMLGGESDMLPASKIVQNMRRSNVKLPLNKEPHSQKEIDDFLNRCELMNGHYFYNSWQVLRLTDIHKNNVSIALYDGLEIKFFKKEFLYGCCCVFGDLNDKEIVLCETYQDTLKSRKYTGKTCICFFETKNLFFIASSLKDKNLMVVNNSDECGNQADDLNVMYGRLSECTN